MADAAAGLGGFSFDPIAFIIVLFIVGIFMAILLAIFIVWFFQRELAILPRKKYRIDLFTHDKATDTEVFSRSLWGWVVSRKNVKLLRISFDMLISGIEVDVGYMRSCKKITDEKGKEIDVIELKEKIHGVRDPSNFEPLHITFEVEPRLERDIRQQSIALSEFAQHLSASNLKDVSDENLNKIKANIINITASLNDNLDKVVDYDRRMQATQVSGWGEFTAVGVEKSSYRVKKSDPWEKYLPYIAIFAVLGALIITTMIGADMFNKTVNTSAGQCAGACNIANEHFIAAATSCGWKETVNATLSLPAGVPAPS